MTSSSIRDYQRRKANFEQAAYDRAIRIINNTIGWDAQFRGTIFINGAAAITPAFELYADGSLAPNGWGYNDVLGAGIAWQEGEITKNWHTDSFPLGINTGNSNDAELFAVAAALDFAKERLQRGEDVRLVRVYTDCMRALEGIQRGTIDWLGPAIDDTWALQKVYNDADWLEGQGVHVELVWVKGHVGTEGNERADKAAKKVVREQIAELGPMEDRKMVRYEDAPVKIKLAGIDAVEEWYWRVNGPLLLRGEVEEEEEAKEEPEDDNKSEGSGVMDISDLDSDNDSSKATVGRSPP